MAEEDEQISIYDEIEIEDMTFDPDLEIYHYPCPCGDRFEIAIADLRDREDIAVCPSCSLMIRVIFELVSGLCFHFCLCSSSLSPPFPLLSSLLTGIRGGISACERIYL